MAPATMNSVVTLGFQSEQEQVQYIVEAITYLEAVAGKQLERDQRNPSNPGSQLNIWMEKLKRYPRWKVKELTEYAGPLNYRVFEYLDALRPVPENAPEFKQLPSPKTNIAKDCGDYIRKLFSFSGPKEEKHKIEIEGLEKLHELYPNAGFDSAKRIRISEINSGDKKDKKTISAGG